MPGERELRVIVVGAGFGGIAATIELNRHGFGDVTVLDRADQLGGTWHHNRYPGAACDVPSPFYSYSYAQGRDWSRLCSLQEEILDYMGGVARDFGVAEQIVPGSEVTSCAWDEDARNWTVTTARGATYEGDAVILATGQLHRLAYPRVEGLDSFAGHSFHSAEWDDDYDLTGKRVAVIGTGASAVQFVPEIAPEVERLVVFQRTGNWFMPRKNRPYPKPLRTLLRKVPLIQSVRRRFWFNYCEGLTMAIRNPSTVGRLAWIRSSLFMRWQVRDRELRKKIWPDYTFGCKRILFSSHFLPALGRPNVDLVTDAIERVTPTGIRTADGREYEVDCIIYGTGFKTNDFMFPMEVSGRDGLTLREAWSEGAHAHLGMTVPGFPSLFVMYGPNTNTSGGSIIAYLEAQAAYIRQALSLVRAHSAAAIAVRPEVEAHSDRDVQARFAGTAWTRCDSWYRDDSGRIVANWPGYMREYFERTALLDPSEYALIEQPAREPAAA